MKAGDRVRYVGPTKRFLDQSQGGIGTYISLHENFESWADIEWDNGHKNAYPISGLEIVKEEYFLPDPGFSLEEIEKACSLLS